MYNLNDFNNNLIVCSDDVKQSILKQINKDNKLYNIKFMTLEQLYTELTFSITKEIVFYVMKEYEVSVNIAKVYLQALKEIYFIDNSDIEKITLLLEIKKQLIKKGYINNQHNYKYYKNLNIKVIGYNFIEKKYQLAFKYLNNVEIELNNTINRKKLRVNQFKTIESEISFVLTQIVKLLKNKVDINKIKITGISEEYYFLLNKFSKMFNIPVTITNNKSLYDIDLGKKFLDSLLDNSWSEFLEVIKKNNQEIYNLIVNILNEYVFVSDYNEVYEMICADFKTTYINQTYVNDIKIVDFDSYSFENDEYVFVMSINQGKMPHIIKDESYITDEIKRKLGLSTSIEINKYNKEKVIGKLFSINNVVLSFSDKLSFSNVQPSTIFNEYGIEIISNVNQDFEHSNQYNQFVLAEKLDDYTKYSVEDIELYNLSKTYDANQYASYDNSFKGIDNKKLKSLLKNEANLSYTSLEKYNKCGFKYYVEDILKLNIYEDIFAAKIGQLYHYVLSKAFNEDFDFEKEFIYSMDHIFKTKTNKESFLLIRLKDELVFLIESIKKQLENINYSKSLFEHEIKIKINDNCNINFKGIIDKVMYEEIDDVIYAALIDYKTGDFEANIKNNCYGLNLQLPIYIYLLKNSSKKNICVTGFYYQPILSNELSADGEEDYEDKKYKYIRLEGYTVDIPDTKGKFDKTEEKSLIIKGLGKTKEGVFSKRSKVLSLSQIDAIEKLVEKKIIEASHNILNGKFDINPKFINKYLSCKNCEFKDLCFVEEKNYKVLEENKDLSFLEEYK